MTSVLAKLRALDAAATPGPWVRCEHSESDSPCGVVWTSVHDESDNDDKIVAHTRRQHDDASYVAAMHAALPLLLEVAEAARAYRDRCANATTPTDISKEDDRLVGALEALSKLDLP